MDNFLTKTIKASTLNGVLFGTFYLFFITFFFTAFYGSKRIYADYKTMLLDQWNKPMIAEIRTVPFKNDCPLGFSVLEMGLTDYFNEGFYCYGGAFNDCTRKTKSPSVQRQAITVWRGTKICVQFLESDSSPLNYNSAFIQAECPISKKDCGVVDTLNNHLCLAQNQKCPIQDLKVIPRSEQTPKHYSRLPLERSKDSEVDLAFTRGNSDAKIISDLRVTHGKICSLFFERDFQKDSTSIFNETYEYYTQCATKIAGLRYNPSFTPIDRYFGSDLVQNLNLSWEEIGKFPFKSLSSEKEFYISTGIYPGNNCSPEEKLRFKGEKTQIDFSKADRAVWLCLAVFLPFLSIILCSSSYGYLKPRMSQIIRFGMIMNSIVFCLFLPFLGVFGYFAVKLGSNQDDRLVKTVLGDKMKDCLDNFTYQAQLIKQNNSVTEAMFLYLGLFHVAVLVYFLFVSFINPWLYRHLR